VWIWLSQLELLILRCAEAADKRLSVLLLRLSFLLLLLNYLHYGYGWQESINRYLLGVLFGFLWFPMSVISSPHSDTPVLVTTVTRV